MNCNELIEFINPLNTSRFKPEGELGALVQDSRQVEENSVFIAIRGTEVDGHLFLEDAIHRGASVIICEESFYTDADVCVIEVENTRNLIGPLAQKFAGNPADKLKIIGITGTNGKTTTATLVYQILCGLQKNVSLLGTVEKRINNEILDSKLTTADPIELANDMRLMVEAESEFLVMEVSSHALHQQRVAGFNFKVAAFTNLSHDHLDYHETIEEYASAKKLLFDNLPEQSIAIINADDDQSDFMIKDCDADIMSFSFNKNVQLVNNSPSGLTINIDNQDISSPLIGTFNAYNVTEAFLICSALGCDKDKTVELLKTVKGASGRMEKVELAEHPTLPVVLVDYAHTPDALENVLSTLASIREGNQQIYCVFGAGGDRDSSKRPMMGNIAHKYADQIIVTSDNPRTENPDVIIADILQGFENTDNVLSITLREDAIHQAIAKATANDIVLIAGKGHEDYQDIDGERYHFDDREIARQALELKAGGEL